MQAAEARGAVAASISTASVLDLAVDDAVILSDSNRLVVRLTPCDVVARVAIAPPAYQARLAREGEVAKRLAETDSPVAGLEPRVEPRVFERDGFAITMWTYFEPVRRMLPPAEYAQTLGRLHAGLRQINVTAPHFMDRVAATQQDVASRDVTPDLAETDRTLLANTLRDLRGSIVNQRAAEQLLHGEPHPGNVLRTRGGLLFVDLETCCRGPIEFDIAHATISASGPPIEVGALYVGADQSLIGECWILMLAMVTAWRCEPGDDLPNGRAMAMDWIRQLRGALGAMT